MKVAEMPVQTFVDLCKANAELGTALLKTLNEQDERYERKSAELEAMKAEGGDIRITVPGFAKGCSWKVDALENYIRRLYEDKRYANDQCVKLAKALDATQKELHDLKEFDKVKFDDVNEMQAERIRELVSENSRIAQECAGVKSENNNLVKSLDEIKRRLDVTNDALKEKVGVIEALDRRNKGMLSQLQDLRNDANKTVGDLQDRWSLLRDRLQLLRDRMSQNAGNVADCINYLDAFVGEVANDTTH